MVKRSLLFTKIYKISNTILKSTTPIHLRGTQSISNVLTSNDFQQCHFKSLQDNKLTIVFSLHGSVKNVYRRRVCIKRVFNVEELIYVEFN